MGVRGGDLMPQETSTAGLHHHRPSGSCTLLPVDGQPSQCRASSTTSGARVVVTSVQQDEELGVLNADVVNARLDRDLRPCPAAICLPDRDVDLGGLVTPIPPNVTCAFFGAVAKPDTQ